MSNLIYIEPENWSEYTLNLYYKYLQPILHATGKNPFYHSVQAKILLDNKPSFHEFPREFSSDAMEIATLDHRHWYFSDSDFIRYINYVCNNLRGSCNVAFIQPFESPLGYEYPRMIDISAMDKKLHERSKIAIDAIKSKKPNIKILSPHINMSLNNLEVVINYFMKYRSLFDIYTLYYFGDYSEQSIAANLNPLYQVMSILHKPLWLNFAIATYQESIPQQSLQPINGVFKSMDEAIAKLKYFIKKVKEITSDIKYIYSGTVKDSYHPFGNVPDCWSNELPLHLVTYNNDWSKEHFCGLLDYNLQPKMPIIRLLEELS